MSQGFYKRRRGILEHLESGRISLIDLAVHDYLNLKANLLVGSACSIPPGVCITSARAIHGACQCQISERTIQRSLEHLESIGWIRRWQVRGKRGNYPVMICRGSVHDASGNEYRVNGAGTRDWQNPKLERVGEVSTVRGIADTLVSTDRELRIENKSFLGAFLTVSQKLDSVVAGRFPGFDRQVQYKKADKWLAENPSRRPKSVSKFLDNWFSRERPATPAPSLKVAEIPELVGAEWNR